MTDSQPEEPTSRNWTVLPVIQLHDGEAVVNDSSQDRFDRVDSLGEGATGVVELSRDHDINRLVAIKRLKNSSDPESVLRFTREVQSLGQLEHPGIVPVHDVGRGEDGRYFLVMKHLVGETLESVIRKLRAGDTKYHSAYPMHERVRICQAVLRIMEYAHDQGVIHRDLKPSNVMIGPHGEVTVVDWGLSKRVGEIEVQFDRADEAQDAATSRHSTRVNARIGTPLYMSPEQARGAMTEVGPASDLYTMGVVFYELLTLEHYLSDQTGLHAILDGAQNEVAKLAYWHHREDQPRIPVEIAYWLQKAMTKSIRKRFHFAVVCPTTLARRIFRVSMESANQRPIVVLLSMLALVALAATGAYAIATALLG